MKPYNSDEDDEEYSDVDEDGGGDNSDYFGDREGSQPAVLPPPKKEGGGGEPSLEEGEIDVEILKEGMKYICGFENCVYKTVHGDHMRRHLQTIHVKLDFRCTLCNAVSYTTQVCNLRRRKDKHFPEKRIFHRNTFCCFF